MKYLYMIDADRSFVQYFENLIFKFSEYKMLGHSFKANDFLIKIQERPDLLSKIDLLLVNPKLNDLNGLDLIKRIQSYREDIRVCVLINENIKNFFMNDIAELGIEHVLIYPADDEYFLNNIEKIFTSKNIVNETTKVDVSNPVDDMETLKFLNSNEFLNQFDFDSLNNDLLNQNNESVKDNESSENDTLSYNQQDTSSLIENDISNFEYNDYNFEESNFSNSNDNFTSYGYLNEPIESNELDTTEDKSQGYSSSVENFLNITDTIQSETRSSNFSTESLDLAEFGFGYDNSNAQSTIQESYGYAYENQADSNENSYSSDIDAFMNQFQPVNVEDEFAPYETSGDLNHKTNLTNLDRPDIDSIDVKEDLYNYKEPTKKNFDSSRNTSQPNGDVNNHYNISNGYGQEYSYNNTNNLGNEYSSHVSKRDVENPSYNPTSSKMNSGYDLPSDFWKDDTITHHSYDDRDYRNVGGNRTEIENMYTRSGINDLSYSINENPNNNMGTDVMRSNGNMVNSPGYDKSINSNINNIPDFAKQIVTIYSTKGGIGKTTVAVNTTIQLAKYSKKKICLVDFDLTNANIHTHLGILDSTYDLSVISNFESEIDSFSLSRIITKYRVKDKNNEGVEIDVIVGFKEMKMSQRFDEKEVHKILTILEDMYDVVVVDTHPVYTDIAVSTILKKATKIIFVAEQEMTALTGAKDFILTSKKYGIPSEKLYLVLNRYKASTQIFTKNRIEKSLGKDIYATIPFDMDSARDAVNTNNPVTISDPYSELARAYLNVAKIIDKNLSIPEEKGGLFSIFKGKS